MRNQKYIVSKSSIGFEILEMQKPVNGKRPHHEKVGFFSYGSGAARSPSSGERLAKDVVDFLNRRAKRQD